MKLNSFCVKTTVKTLMKSSFCVTLPFFLFVGSISSVLCNSWLISIHKNVPDTAKITTNTQFVVLILTRHFHFIQIIVEVFELISRKYFNVPHLHSSWPGPINFEIITTLFMVSLMYLNKSFINNLRMFLKQLISSKQSINATKSKLGNFSYTNIKSNIYIYIT